MPTVIGIIPGDEQAAVRDQPLDPNGKPVRGLIIAQHISERIRYALADVPGVTAREYILLITLADVPHVDTQTK
jgi:hypothetical protein